jgi:hypothetical protein
MLKDEVWSLAMTSTRNPDMLCIGCVESRISRLLTKEDFSDAPLNSMPFWPRSERLKSRLGLTGPTFHE